MIMKHLSCYLTLLLLVLAGGILQSCKDDDEGTPPVPKPEIALVAGTAGTNSVDLKLTNTNMKEYAYQVTTNLTSPAPSAAILFGTGTTGKLVEGENTITITGLEGNTEYMLHLATKSDAGFGEKVFSERIKTATYTELLTITDRHFTGVSFHIEVPAGKHIGYAILELENYLGFKKQFGFTDADFLTQSMEILDQSKTVTFTEMPDPETGEIFARFHPGEAVVIVVGEMEMGVDPWDPEKEMWMPCFDFEKYVNGGGGDLPLQETPSITEEECWYGVHKVASVNCKAPEVANADIDIKLEKKTTRTVEYSVTPDGSVLAYCYNYVDMATWEGLVTDLGEEGTICWFTMNSPSASDPMKITCENLQAGITYKLIIIGKTTEDGTKHVVKLQDFTPGESTKPAPEIQVTGIRAPAGEIESPYTVWFNIKALSQDAVTAKYLANSIKGWVSELTAGATYLAIMDQYGNSLDAAAIAGMNSSAGFNISFPSWEDSDTRLVVCGYNDEEVSNSPDKDARGLADNRTIEEPAATPVTSDLFEDLTGDWTATATLLVSTYDAETGKYIETVSPTPKIAKVTISQGLEYPADCPSEVYPMYPNNDKEFVDNLYADFLESAAKYNRKTKQQNRLLCEGLELVKYYTDYLSPYGLFINETYSAYDTDELFFNFGPKWYLQIGEGDQVCVPTDLSRMPPLSAWYYETLYLAGLGSESYDPSLEKFDVTVSADKQTLTIEPAVVKDQTLYPSVVSLSNGFAVPQAKCKSLVLTKGWSEAAAKASRMNIGNISMPRVPGTTYFSPAKPYHRTRLGEVKVIEYKTVSVEPVSLKEIRKAKLVKPEMKRPVR